MWYPCHHAGIIRYAGIPETVGGAGDQGLMQITRDKCTGTQWKQKGSCQCFPSK